MLVDELWSRCTELLQQEISAQMFSTWIKPLQPEIQGRSLVLLAPNRFVLQWVADKYSARLQSLVKEVTQEQLQEVSLAVGSRSEPQTSINSIQTDLKTAVVEKPTTSVQGNVFSHSSSSDVNNLTAQKNNSLESFQANLQKLVEQQVPAVMEKAAEKKSSSNKGKKSDGVDKYKSTLNPLHTFDNLVEGKSNQIARAASLQVAEAPGVYNPLFIYGGVGLGKTHLMHAVGNQIMQLNPNAKVVYLNSERFVQDMVKALQINAINDFKRFYRNLDALLIDDIQFFIGKDRSQEEFFYTFNSLLEGGKQIIVTSDRYPKEIGVEERLKSRFSWGLTVAIEPPELELRVAILMKKAEAARVNLSQEVAFFIAKKIRSHVRDLEGALNRVVADSHFKGQPITIDLVRESLKDLFAVQDKQVSIENIQRSVADYYKIKIADLHSKRRNRSIARPRQVAMALAKELTSHSLPEIGDAFGGRDHTTVLHACKRVKSLQNESPDIREDWKNLLRLLTS